MLFAYPDLHSWEDPHAAEIVARQTMTDVLQALNVIVLSQPAAHLAVDVMQRDIDRSEQLAAAVAKFA